MDTKGIITKAAYELFEEVPFEDITVQVILDRAHVSRRTFYKYYMDKYELMHQYCYGSLEKFFYENYIVNNWEKLWEETLMFISEKEIAVYLMLHGAWTDLPECPYSVHALRGEVRRMLATLESKHPGTMLNLMESKAKIETRCAGNLETEPVRHCTECGDPCSGEICQLCNLKKTLR